MMQLSTTRIVSGNMTSFLVLNHERVRYHSGLLKPNDNRCCDHIANDNINHLQDASKLCLQKLNDSLAKKPMSTQAKSATWMLSTKHQKLHYVLYYLDIVSNYLEIYDLGIIRRFFYLEKVNFHLGKDYFNLISLSI
jgi:hypothetical protein